MGTAPTHFAVPQGAFVLERGDIGAAAGLQAWDAADVFALEYLAGAAGPVGADLAVPLRELPLRGVGSVMVINDGFGALALALAEHRPWSWSDSAIAHDALVANLERNGVDADSVRWLTSTQDPTEPVDILVVKVPKTLAMLEDQLLRVAPVLHASTLVVGAGMTRHVHTATIELFERIIGPVATSRARRKARLILATVDPGRVGESAPGPSPYPTSFDVDADLLAGAGAGGDQVRIWNHANVFSRSRLDQGTRFLLENIPPAPAPAPSADADTDADTDGRPSRIVDLGCGNGVLGIAAARRHPDAHVTFIDESAMAVASAELGFREAFGERDASFVQSNGAATMADGSADLVLLNPPFHSQHAIDSGVGRALIAEGHRLLRTGGSLWIVANRHVGHHVSMRRCFGNVVNVASDPKFVVLHSVRR